MPRLSKSFDLPPRPLQLKDPFSGLGLRDVQVDTTAGSNTNYKIGTKPSPKTRIETFPSSHSNPSSRVQLREIKCIAPSDCTSLTELADVQNYHLPVRPKEYQHNVQMVGQTTYNRRPPLSSRKQFHMGNATESNRGTSGLPFKEATGKHSVLSSDWQQDKKENSLHFHQSQIASNLTEAAVRALEGCNGATILARYLRPRLSALFPDKSDIPTRSDLQTIILSKWIEETVRFLAIKTLACDTKIPFEMAASKPIDEAWRGMLLIPAAYARVCHILGNEDGILIDYDPFWQEEQVGFAQRKRRMDCTLRCYRQYFNQSAPELYWLEPKEPSGGRFLTVYTQAKQFFQQPCQL